MVLPSAANFVLCDLGRSAAAVNEALLRQGVIVRPVANYGLPNHLRITTGTAVQNERVLAAMAVALANRA
jgi:histidinol-phosphate aminotransferase